MPFVVAIIVFGIISLLIYIIYSFTQRKQSKHTIDDLYDEVTLLRRDLNELRSELNKDHDKISLNF